MELETSEPPYRTVESDLNIDELEAPPETPGDIPAEELDGGLICHDDFYMQLDEGDI